MSRRWTEETATAPLDLRLALPATAVWAGCLVALWAPAAVWWVLAGIAATVAASAVVARRRHCPVGVVVTLLLCCSAAIAVTALRIAAANQDPLVIAAHSASWVEIDVTVRGDPTPQPDRWAAAPDGGNETAVRPPSTRWRLSARAATVTAHGVRWPSRSSVVIFGDGSDWGRVADGQRLRIRGTVGVDDFNPLPGVVIRARGDPQIVEAPSSWTAWAADGRGRLARSARVLDADRGGLLRGLVVGDTRGIGPELSADAKVSGLTHLVAVSGSHMAIVAAAVLLLLRRFGPTLSGIGVALAFGALVMVVGPTPSVLRAVIMGLIGVLGAVMGRSRSALSALSATVFGLLLIDPSLAVAVGFVLSVQATAALILVAPMLTAALERRHVPRGWAMVIAVPIAAHVATVPVIAAISGSVSLVAIPANIAVSAVVAPGLLIGLACLIGGAVSPSAGEVIARLDGPLLGWIAGCAHRFARLPSATLPWSATAWGVVALGVLIAGGLIVLRFRRARAVVLVALAAAAVVLVAARLSHVGWPGGRWLITACDVGQGDGIVLATDEPGTAIVVDTGPEPRAMDDCLDRLGVRTIALLVLTHLHADHVGGIRGAIEGRAVAAIGLGPDRTAPAALDEITRISESRGISITALAPGMSITVAGLRLDVLGPARTFRGTDSDSNNDSVVMRGARAGVTMLLTGDIERPAQQALLDAGVDLTADILKQPHHGSSKLLPKFVDAVGAEVAIIGVGVGNDYGHPAASALDTDRRAGIRSILRTDQDGDAQVIRVESGLAVMSRGAPAATMAAAP
jgi:competence protein ComEC